MKSSLTVYASKKKKRPQSGTTINRPRQGLEIHSHSKSELRNDPSQKALSPRINTPNQCNRLGSQQTKNWPIKQLLFATRFSKQNEQVSQFQ